MQGEVQSGLSPQELAERSHAAMWVGDRACQGLGIEVLVVSPGAAMLSMRVREDMLNGLGLCHGGLIATLADSAFAYACNSWGDATVASGFGIDLLAPAKLGDRLTATARVVTRAGRTGLYDVEVTNQDGHIVAVFRGRSTTLRLPKQDVPG